jgi:hypothetical protein
MRLTEEERVFILESYLKTMSYVHCKHFFLKFRSQAPAKCSIVKMIKNSVKQVHFGQESLPAEVSVNTRDTGRYSNGC